MKKKIIIVVFLIISIGLNAQSLKYPSTTKKNTVHKHVLNKPIGGDKSIYHTDGKWITGYNLDRYNNRPIYINHTNGLIVAGDKPLIRFAKDKKLFGTLVVSFKRNGKTIPLCDFNQIKSQYAAGQMKWVISDSRYKGLSLNLNVLPAASNIGMVVKISTTNAQANDELKLSFGGPKEYPKRSVSYDFDAMGYPEILKWKQTGIEKTKPLFEEVLDTKKDNGNFLFLQLNSTGEVSYQTGKDAEQAYNQAQDKLEEVVGRMKINTPDLYLNAVAKASVFAIDREWYPPVFVHGDMIYNTAYPGWRIMYGATMYGWHDRILEEAKYYIASQVKESDRKTARADTQALMTLQNKDSRLFGVGRIVKDQRRYDMQSQFFDQLIEDYRWTSSPELIKVLREALELHLQWIQDCFDPDGDGVYESYLNTWPTDSQWYNGGGTAEETSYAYRGHLAARDMAHNAGDKKSEDYHNQMLQKIRKGFFDKLWISNMGYSGSYREQGGHERLHTNPWLYSIFLPVDAGLTSPTQAIESVYYSEWALQNDLLPYGGREVWTSNWVPGIWSVREKWPGDNYGLALSYFQAGLPQDAWDVMRGTYLHTAFNDLVPGNLGSHQGGTDFGDCMHPFSRALVEGLFGYLPDYPNGKVQIAPCFPNSWNHASIELPDVKIAFKRYDAKTTYTVSLSQQSDILLHLPVQCREVLNVTLNGKVIKWELEPGVGCSKVKLDIKDAKNAAIVIYEKGVLPYYKPVFVEGNIGERIALTTKDARITAVEDPESITEDKRIEAGSLHARLTANKGYHTVIAHVITGKTPQNRVFRIKINDPVGDAKKAASFVKTVPQGATWQNVDIASQYNADVTTIYKQKYLSPRPNTVSARLGTDGYSPWTFPVWKSYPPEIKTDSIPAMLKAGNQLMTRQGIPFNWSNGDKNIAFTSMWDNYPAKIDFAVNKKGKAIYFLIAGSTNIMQCQIANAVIRLNYADGATDSLALIPPVNYWNLSPISAGPTSPGQSSRNDYTAEIDKFCLPKVLPETVQLGKNCRAMLLNLKMRKGEMLKSVTLETLSQEVVVGLIGITVMN